jgi:hypothetical protein
MVAAPQRREMSSERPTAWQSDLTSVHMEGKFSFLRRLRKRPYPFASCLPSSVFDKLHFAEISGNVEPATDVGPATGIDPETDVDPATDVGPVIIFTV